MKYAIRLIGGRFDGDQVPELMQPHREPLPQSLMLGTCGQGHVCGSQVCRREQSHSSWWDLDEVHPVDCVEYVLESEAPRAACGPNGGPIQAVAVYVIGGLSSPNIFGDKAREPVRA